MAEGVVAADGIVEGGSAVGRVVAGETAENDAAEAVVAADGIVEGGSAVSGIVAGRIVQGNSIS